MDGYKLFGRDRQGKRGGGVALYVRDYFDCMELNDCDDKIECLLVKMRWKANKADILLGVYYRPPNQDEEADEVFYKRLAEVSQLLALVLVGDLNLLDICWKYNIAERRVEMPGVCGRSLPDAAGVSLPGEVPRLTCYLLTEKDWWEMWWLEATWS